MDAEGNDLIQLTFGEVSDWEPKWSPDGTLIAFTSNRSGGFNNIYVMDSDSSNIVRAYTSTTSEELKCRGIGCWINPTTLLQTHYIYTRFGKAPREGSA